MCLCCCVTKRDHRKKKLIMGISKYLSLISAYECEC